MTNSLSPATSARRLPFPSPKRLAVSIFFSFLYFKFPSSLSAFIRLWFWICFCLLLLPPRSSSTSSTGVPDPPYATTTRPELTCNSKSTFPLTLIQCFPSVPTALVKSWLYCPASGYNPAPYCDPPRQFKDEPETLNALVPSSS